MEKTLNLIVRQPWFGMEASREKHEEYREITGYWVKRLLTSALDPKYVSQHADAIAADIKEHGLSSAMTSHKLTPVDYAKVVIANGYHKDRLVFTAQFRGLTVGTGRPEWGAPEYPTFIIKM